MRVWGMCHLYRCAHGVLCNALAADRRTSLRSLSASLVRPSDKKKNKEDLLSCVEGVSWYRSGCGSAL